MAQPVACGMGGHALLMRHCVPLCSCSQLSCWCCRPVSCEPLSANVWLIAGAYNITSPGGAGNPLWPDDCAHAGWHAAAAGLCGPAASQTHRCHLTAATLCTCPPRWALSACYRVLLSLSSSHASILHIPFGEGGGGILEDVFIPI